MGITTLLLAALACGPVALLWLVLERPGPARSALGAWLLRLRRTSPVVPNHRPIEEIAVDVRRLALRYHGLHPRIPHVKVVALTAAYDGALGECCHCLGVPHLLGVLDAGVDLDAERKRVERRLASSGVIMPDAA